ncbi:MAG: zinc-dependent metalloprotease [Planctomycetota bacterium]
MSLAPRSAAAAALLLLLLAAGAVSAAPTTDAKKLLEGTKPHAGLFTVHQGKDKAFLEVPAGRLNQPFLLATSIRGGPTYAGFQWRDTVCVFRRLDDQLLLIEKEVRYRLKDRSKPIAEVVQRTYTDRLMARAPIVALQGESPLIDLEAFFGGQAQAFFGAIAARFDGRVVMLDKVKAFPENLELAVTVPDGRRDGRFTALSYSLSALPMSSDYQPRLADDRVGYFTTAVKDFGDETADGDRFVRFVNRWDLRKADPRLPRSPVAQPIVFYVERTVPYRFREAVREGISAWNDAFAGCGLQNAVVVRQQTNTEFNELDPEDVRYNFFRWIVSERGFAMGPSRTNPWTGQILDADIVFDESMVRAYIREYDLAIRSAPRSFLSPEVQQALRDRPSQFPLGAELLRRASEDELFEAPKARFCSLGEGVSHQLSLGFLALGLREQAAKGQEFPQAFLDQIVKDVVMHEVGHTLGLRHNFQASTWRELKQINSAERPGDVCASVMDYNPINVTTDPERQGHYTMQGLGPYDHWAIRYGYHPDEAQAKAGIAQVASEQFAYATDEDTSGPDPYVQRWDLGQDPLEYARQRMALVDRLLPKAVERAVQPGEGYADGRRAVDMLLYDYQGAALSAARFVGGQRTWRHHKGDPGARPALEPVAADKQREALQLICQRVLAQGSLALEPKLLRELGKGHWSHWGSRDGEVPASYPYQDRVLAIQSWALYMLTNPQTMARLLDTEAKVDKGAALLTVPEVFTTLSETIFAKLLDPTQLSGKGTVEAPLVPTLQRNLQRHYVGRLIDMVLEGEGGPTPAAARQVARLEVKLVKNALEACLAQELPDHYVLDPYTRGHLEEIVGRLEQALKASYQLR